MLMGILACILLLLLGAMAAARVVNEKIPACRNAINAIMPYQDTIGIVGLLYGIVMVLKALQALAMAGISLLSIFALFVACLTLALGFLYGLNFIRSNVKNTQTPFMLKMEGWHLKLLPYKEKMGIAAIISAVVALLLFL